LNSKVETGKSMSDTLVNKAVKFLKKNLMSSSNIPLSYLPINEDHKTVQEYWKSVHKSGTPEEQIERVLATYGLILYDGACWQIAVTLGNPAHYHLAEQQTRLIWLERHGEGLWKPSTNKEVDRNNFDFNGMGILEHPYLYRFISDKYLHPDPINPKVQTEWRDWLPVLGENAWCQLLGPLMSYKIFLDEQKQAPELDSLEIQLALRSVLCFGAMQSSIGAVYYSPRKDKAGEISVENNASLYAGLQVLRSFLLKIGDSSQKHEIANIEQILKGIENFVQYHAFHSSGEYLVQGGTARSDSLESSGTAFAVDCQTWGLSVWGEAIDTWRGAGTSFTIWQKTKEMAGLRKTDEMKGFEDFNSGDLLGVGYSDENSKNNAALISGEWTLGAVNMCLILANFYDKSNANAASELRSDADTMLRYVRLKLSMETAPGQVALKYANKRYYIPFGWYSNPIPATASTAWFIMLEKQFNPLEFSGTYTFPQFFLKKDETWN
jgi:hypothetical protein